MSAPAFRSGGSLYDFDTFLPSREDVKHDPEAADAREQRFASDRIPLDAEGKRTRIEPAPVVMGALHQRQPVARVSPREARIPEPKEPAPMRTGTPAPEARQSALRSHLQKHGPTSSAQLAEAFTYYRESAGSKLIAADTTAIGAVRTGNRLSPWALPETSAKKAATEKPVPAPERSSLADVSTQALIDELGRRAATVDRIREALGGLK